MFSAVSLAVVLLSFHALRSSPVVAPSPKESDRAFLNAWWGMKPTEVAVANSATLRPVIDSKRYFYDAQADPSRYRSFEQQEAKFLGRPAKVTYTFHDDRLFTYHVFVSDTDGDRLDADMRHYLMKKFGDRASEQEEESTLRLVWQFRDRMINYWFMQEELSLRPKYTAGFGVTIHES